MYDSVSRPARTLLQRYTASGRIRSDARLGCGAYHWAVLIVLDATVLVADLVLRGSALRSTLAEATRAGHEIAIPEVVIRETVNRYAEMLSQSRSDLKRSAAKLRRLDLGVYQPRLFGAGRTPPQPSPPWGDVDLPDVEACVEEYRGWLTDRLDEYSVNVLPIVTIAHQDVVDRDLARRKPFSAGGKGYRDYLIWLAVLDAAAVGNEVLFVSSNTKDFTEDGETLHPDLRWDLQERGIQSTAVLLRFDASSVFDEFIRPTLERLEGIGEQLLRNEYAGLDLIDGLLVDMLSYTSLTTEDAGLPEGFDSPYVVGVLEASEFDSADVRQMSDGSVLARLHGKVTVDLDISLDRNLWTVLLESEDARVHVNGPLNESYMEATVVRDLNVEFEFVFEDLGDNGVEIIGYELLAVDPSEEW